MSQEPREDRKGCKMLVAMGLGAIGGALLALLLVCYCTLPELFERLAFARNGGVGEKADWGEPLFYLIVLAVAFCLPAVLIGALVAGGVLVLFRVLRGLLLWLLKSK